MLGIGQCDHFQVNAMLNNNLLDWWVSIDLAHKGDLELVARNFLRL